VPSSPAAIAPAEGRWRRRSAAGRSDTDRLRSPSVRLEAPGGAAEL